MRAHLPCCHTVGPVQQCWKFSSQHERWCAACSKWGQTCTAGTAETSSNLGRAIPIIHPKSLLVVVVGGGWLLLLLLLLFNVLLLLLYNDRNISENRGYVSLLSWHHHWGFYMMPILNPIHGWMIIPFYGKIITALINAHSPHRHPNGLIVWSQCFRVSIVVSEIWLKHVKTCYPLVFLHSYGKWPMYRWFMIIYLLKGVIFHGFIAAD